MPDFPVRVPDLRVRTRNTDLTLDGGSEYRIGRDPRAAIVLSDPRVSWTHAVLRPVGGTWVLLDTGSTNGTWVGIERVSRMEITGIVVVGFGDPEDGVIMRLEPQLRMPEPQPMRWSGPGMSGT